MGGESNRCTADRVVLTTYKRARARHGWIYTASRFSRAHVSGWGGGVILVRWKLESADVVAETLETTRIETAAAYEYELGWCVTNSSWWVRHTRTCDAGDRGR